MNIRLNLSLVLFLAVLTCITAGMTGCTNILTGYDMDYMHGRYNPGNPLPQAILVDVQNFIRSEKISSSEISDLTFGEDHKGGHVAVITQEYPKSRGRKYKEYVLYYNKDNVRTGVRTFHGTRDETNFNQRM